MNPCHTFEWLLWTFATAWCYWSLFKAVGPKPVHTHQYMSTNYRIIGSKTSGNHLIFEMIWSARSRNSMRSPNSKFDKKDTGKITSSSNNLPCSFKRFWLYLICVDEILVYPFIFHWECSGRLFYRSLLWNWIWFRNARCLAKVPISAESNPLLARQIRYLQKNHSMNKSERQGPRWIVAALSSIKGSG